MANDVLQFVDSISASATVRLDLNDGVTWGVGVDGFDFSAPPLRRAINGTLLTDGSVQSASSYDNRTLSGVLELSAASVDACATQMQLLHRELDRDCNYLKWQPNGATSPVFFRTLRTPPDNVEEASASGAYKRLTVAIVAEPFALGLREDVAPVTVNNDPAAGSNGLFFDVTGVKGDVATPIIVNNTEAAVPQSNGVIAARQRGTPSDLLHFRQAESLTLTADTTNPGGGPDAAMSGTGTNNFARTSFAVNTAMTIRLTWTGAGLTVAQRKALRGMFRIIVVVRRSASTSVIQLQASRTIVTNQSVTNLPTTLGTGASTQIVDLGLMNLGGAVVSTPGYSVEAPLAVATGGNLLELSASRTGGTDTLDWDYVFLVPADESIMFYAGSSQSLPWVMDGINERMYQVDSTSSPFVGTVGIEDINYALSGGFPVVRPNQTNRFYYAEWTTGAIAKTRTPILTVSYWPRYLYVRPATT